MGIIDWIILGVLLIFVFLGWRKGFAANVIQLCGYILSFFLVGHYYPLVQRSLMQKYDMAAPVAVVISVLIILALLVVITKVVIYVISRVLVASKLSTPDKALGALIGFCNGLLIVIIFMVMLDFLPSVSTPLKDGENHRVYAGVNVLKEEMFTKLKLTERMKLIKMPKLHNNADSPISIPTGK